MCLFVSTSKWYLNCPFSPGIEEHAGNGEIPSYEGSTVLFVALCCMRCDAFSMSCTAICSISLNSVYCTLYSVIKLCCALF